MGFRPWLRSIRCKKTIPTGKGYSPSANWAAFPEALGRATLSANRAFNPLDPAGNPPKRSGYSQQENLSIPSQGRVPDGAG